MTGIVGRIEEARKAVEQQKVKELKKQLEAEVDKPAPKKAAKKESAE